MALPFPGASDPSRVAVGVANSTGVFSAPDMTFRTGGRFNLTVLAPGFVGSYRLVRSFDAGATWAPCTFGGSDVVFVGAISEVINEPEQNVLYAIEVLAISAGILNYRFSQ